MAIPKPTVLLLFVVAVVAVAYQTDECGQARRMVGHDPLEFLIEGSSSYCLWYRVEEEHTATNLTLKLDNGQGVTFRSLQPFSSSNIHHFWRIYFLQFPQVIDVIGRNFSQQIGRGDISGPLPVTVRVVSNKPVVWFYCTRHDVLPVSIDVDSQSISQPYPNSSNTHSVDVVILVVLGVVAVVLAVVATGFGMVYYRRITLKDGKNGGMVTETGPPTVTSIEQEIRHQETRDQDPRDQEDVYHIYDEWGTNYAAGPITHHSIVNSLYQPMTP